MNLKYLLSREGVSDLIAQRARMIAERRMNEIGIDRSQKLRDDMFYLWHHGYETFMSCRGHRYESSESRPYIMYFLNTGDGSWEAEECEKRGWHNDAENLREEDKGFSLWSQDAPLPLDSKGSTQPYRDHASLSNAIHIYRAIIANKSGKVWHVR